MMCRSSVGKVSNGPIEEDVRVLGRTVDLIGSETDIIASRMCAGRQLRLSIRASTLELSRAIACSVTILSRKARW